ncbi:MAG: hypothetical protein ISR47_06345 [Rhodospirillales bacterium]|nr:hypothetical protein [Rhodospirillales bacterium]
MGFTVGAVHWLYDVKKRHNLGADCFSLGRYSCHFDLNALFKILLEQGIVSRTDKNTSFPHTGQLDIDTGTMPAELIRFLETHGTGPDVQITDDVLLKILGFDSIESVDVHDGEKPTYVYDLNNPDLFSVVGKRYSTVFNLGTMEHVFSPPTVLKNMFDVCKIGGHMVHVYPYNNWGGHGFYQFSPELLYSYYTANHFDIEAIGFVSTGKDHTGGLFSYTAVPPKPLSMPKVEDTYPQTGVTIVRKREDSTWDQIPQQTVIT